MDPTFRLLIDQEFPKINREVCEGLATVVIPRAEEYIDQVFRAAAKSFPEGLEYTGYVRCTPHEEYEEITRVKNNKRFYDLAKSNIYMVKYFFRYDGVDLPPRYIYLPFVNEAGILYIGGSMFHVSPVITDVVISPTHHTVFIRLIRDRIVFERQYHSMVINGVKETEHVSWAMIHRMKKSGRKIQDTTKAKTCAVHYLLAKYGLRKSLEKFFQVTEVIVGREEINEKHYPKDDWVICESTQLKPATFIYPVYNPTAIKVAIPKEQWNQDVKIFMLGFFYVVDHFPTRIHPSYVDRTETWMILLGHIISSGHYGDGKLYDLICDHLESVDHYVDPIVAEKLAHIGYQVNDFYELLALIIKHFNEWVANYAEINVSLYGKTMEILYYVLFNVTSAIFNLNFKLNKLASKKKLMTKDGQVQRMTARDVIELMGNYLKHGEIFRVRRDNVAVNSVSYSGDNKYPKITSVCGLQQSTPGARRQSHKNTVIDETKRLHVSQLDAGSVLFLSKTNPTPTSHANLFIRIDLGNGEILPKEKFKPLLAKVGALFKYPLKGAGHDDTYDVIDSDREE